jgi:hypothetical protein
MRIICNIYLLGFYGKPPNCQICPLNSYNSAKESLDSYIFETTCAKCPPFSTTKKIQSSSIYDCLCDAGRSSLNTSTAEDGNWCRPCAKVRLKIINNFFISL